MFQVLQIKFEINKYINKIKTCRNICTIQLRKVYLRKLAKWNIANKICILNITRKFFVKVF